MSEPASVVVSGCDKIDQLFGGLRIDDATKMASVIDVARAVTGLGSNDARKYALTAAKQLGINFPQLRINGRGRETPVADAKTLIQLVWELPGKAAKSFRRDCANYICRVLGGDESLLAEMELRVRYTPEEQKQFFMQNTARPDIELLEREEQRLLVKRKYEMEFAEAEERIKRMRIETEELQRKNFEALCNLMGEDEMDDRDRINIADFKRRFQQQNIGTAIVALESGRQITAAPVAPPKLEISIPQTARTRGLHYRPAAAGQIGKLMKQLYTARHHEEPVKRRVHYLGRPIDENAYWSEDEDLMVAAITKFATNATADQLLDAQRLIDSTFNKDDDE